MCVTQEDYLRDGLNEADAIVSSLDLKQTVTEVIPVVFPLAKKSCLLFLVKLRNTRRLIIALPSNEFRNMHSTTNIWELLVRTHILLKHLHNTQ